MTSSQQRPSSNTSVWYFVGATFIISAPLLFFPDAPTWARIGLLMTGFCLIVAGFMQLRIDLKRRGPRPDASR